jgi:hypothetical protein
MKVVHPDWGQQRRPTFVACDQSTPLVPLPADMSWLARPTPMMERIGVCELDAGSPRYLLTLSTKSRR